MKNVYVLDFLKNYSKTKNDFNFMFRNITVETVFSKRSMTLIITCIILTHLHIFYKELDTIFYSSCTHIHKNKVIKRPLNIVFG